MRGGTSGVPTLTLRSTLWAACAWSQVAPVDDDRPLGDDIDRVLGCLDDLG